VAAPTSTPPFAWQWPAFVFAFVSLAVCFQQGWSRSPAGMDLIQYVVPSQVWLEGGNPYDVAQYPNDFRRLTRTTPEVIWSCPFLPHTFALLAPLASLSWPTACRLWWLISFGSLILAFHCLWKQWGQNSTPSEFLFFVGILAQSRLIQSVAYRGQFSLFVLALGLQALVWAQQGRAVLAGLLLAVACIKYTLALPFVAYFMWKRHWRALASAAVFLVAGCLAAALPMGLPTVARTLPESVAAFLHQDQSEASYHVMHWMGLYATAFGASSRTAWWLNLLTTVAVAVGIAAVYRRHGSEDRGGWGLAAVTIASLTALYHRVYDGVLVFIVAAVFWNTFRVSKDRRSVLSWLLAVVLILFLFVFAVQSFAERIATAALGATNMKIFFPVNSWLGVGLLSLTFARSLRRDRVL
jgi:Glycosyltransferase family 87